MTRLVAGMVLACLWPDEWRKRARRRRAVARPDGSVDQRRRPVPRRLDRAVRAAYGYRCVYCGAPGTDVDHVKPYWIGGKETLWNLSLLCRRHNLAKGVYWVYPGGNVIGLRNAEAPEILAAERRARRNPLRYVRAAWAA